ncbi:DUF6152 family protein [Larkinella terrae]|uniref:DUF5666 domain-containing protein n=1 Tax=Larkinella terrae TaxID=2025311 RepID=A0A7K0EP52_9BACT|nr:DUF6152 family protein [Larkinella terrae]MRS63623.1 hypothetical protein [Larkinella terrae]
MNLLKTTSFALLIFLGTAFAPLHHGWGDYDQTKVLDYTGTIEESKFENPHVLAKVKDKNKTWLVYLAPVSRMQERGVTPDMLKKGSSLRIVGYPHKTAKNEMRAERLFIGDKKYEMRK